MDNLRAELHCHNEFSNFQLGVKETPYDCGITVQEQLEQAYKSKLDTLFITNHNTLDGYNQLLHYRENHEKFRNIHVYPGEEVTTDQGIHVLAYGLNETISPGQSLEEILDIVRSQGAVSCAPHPFALNNGLREKSVLCDLIEVFNSNNVDRYSNLRASHFAKINNMIEVAGSDSHVVSTLGRCINVIEAENTLDGILRAMRTGKITIDSMGYIACNEMIEHARYKIKNSKDDIMIYFRENHPHLTGICRFLIDAFESNPDSMVWKAVYRVAVHLTTKLSNKINFKNQDYNILYERNLRAILPMILI
ncbi:MAG: PHP-associated domain-containing protein [Nitrosotalea sp.]